MNRSLRMMNDALAALCYGGFVVGAGTAGKLLIGIGSPLVAAVVWGLFAAPRAKVKLPLGGVIAVKVVVFGAAAGALCAAGQVIVATAFALLLIVNTVIATIRRLPGSA